MKSRCKAISLLIGIFLIFSLIGCTNSNDDSKPLSKTEYFMGTVVTVTLYDNKSEKIIDKAFEEVKKIEQLVSINMEGTELDEVNNNAGIKPVKVSDDTYNIIKKGLEYSSLTNGSFDITIGPLVKLWSIGLPEAKVPTIEEIKEKIQYINYNDVELNNSEKTVFLKKPGMIIDLGGIAKGYTADVIAQTLKDEGVEKAIIDLGGNIYALGEKAENTLWRIGIQNPDQTRGEIVGSINVKDKSIVTSGIYERFIEQDGVKYHHILSPKSGYPYDNEIAGVTIISDKSIDGDALSTSVFSMGITKGLEFINSLPDTEAIFITKDHKIYLTEGSKEIFKLTNDDFQIINY
ncbi:MAG: FAD:protein FMN transferase [Clostridium sp.]|uniref:FAD:protein FMN transferase n=1 Tax=Clostridium paraputrificum TaxID=29363 RepID=A0A6N3A239_9CLOT|nr:FAD:protein FMN transferase [Clostridium sp.]MBS5926306.1 FAD:protein FMN transferase [Clostridium sp.]MBS5986619.1 FAD:protein FMN transferase [Clostridium sp.]